MPLFANLFILPIRYRETNITIVLKPDFNCLGCDFQERLNGFEMLSKFFIKLRLN